jgi:hypothetical protein
MYVVLPAVHFKHVFKIYDVNQRFKYFPHHAPNVFKKIPKQFMLVRR